MDYWPEVREYETHTTRTFPVVRLDPVECPSACGRTSGPGTRAGQTGITVGTIIGRLR